MKIFKPDGLLPAFHQLIRRSGSKAYLSIAVVFCLTVLVWMSFSSVDIRDINGWLPYHAPVSIFLSLILLILVIRSWIKMLLDGEPPANITEKDPQLSPEPKSKAPFVLKSMFRKPPHVLVVDDDTSVRMVLCKKLSVMGVRATGARDGLEALLAVADRQWDMVLMDGEMPFMDGIEATRAIRGQHLLPDCTPIVGVTSNCDGEYRQKCLSAGMNACRPKPRHTEDLESLLDEFLVMEPPAQTSTLDDRMVT